MKHESVKSEKNCSNLESNFHRESVGKGNHQDDSKKGNKIKIDDVITSLIKRTFIASHVKREISDNLWTLPWNFLIDSILFHLISNGDYGSYCIIMRFHFFSIRSYVTERKRSRNFPHKSSVLS